MQQYLRALQDARKQFCEKNIISPIIKPCIANSWKKCREHGLDPNGTAIPQIVSPEEMAECQRKNKDLITVASPLIEKLFSSISFPLESIWLTDKNCIILDLHAPSETLEDFQNTNICFGANWGEFVAGTNPAALAIQTDSLIQMIGGEQFFAGHSHSCGVAIPIHSTSGSIIGSLALSMPVNAVTSFTILEMINSILTASAYAIERQIEITRISKLNQTVFKTMSDGIIVTDDNLHIMNVNKSCSMILRTDQDELLGKSLISIFPKAANWNNNIPPEYDNDSELIFNINGKNIRCRGIIQNILFYNQSLGTMITFTSEKQYNRKINKAFGNKAFYTFDSIITQNTVMLSMLEDAKRVAQTNLNILILGDSGTGKELLAQSIHNASKRYNEPLVIVNCAALPRELVESELFGYEKGSFTGALNEGQIGKFELANGGTLFLDEIGELPLEIQPKLLRAIENGKITRIGGKHEKKIDVRLICATNRDLKQEVNNKNFRLDLYYRINVLTLQVPSLAERKDDIPLLAEHFLTKLNNESDTHKTFNDTYIENLMKISWEGNIRQLENTITQSFYFTTDDEISNLPSHLNATIHCAESNSSKIHLRNMQYPSEESALPVISMEDTNLQAIVHALQSNNGNILKAAADLKIGKSTLYRKIKKYNINPKDYINR